MFKRDACDQQLNLSQPQFLSCKMGVIVTSDTRHVACPAQSTMLSVYNIVKCCFISSLSDSKFCVVQLASLPNKQLPNILKPSIPGLKVEAGEWLSVSSRELKWES